MFVSHVAVSKRTLVLRTKNQASIECGLIFTSYKITPLVSKLQRPCSNRKLCKPCEGFYVLDNEGILPYPELRVSNLRGVYRALLSKPFSLELPFLHHLSIHFKKFQNIRIVIIHDYRAFVNKNFQII